MPVDWHAYDRFDWSHSRQAPMGERERATLADMVAELLALPPDDRLRVWGAASPPGRYAATVVQVGRGIPHRYQECAATRGLDAIGVKIFKTTEEARRQGQRLLSFHRGTVRCLPGLPNTHVQASLTAGTIRDREGAERHFVIQEWVAGDTLDHWLRHWIVHPIDGGQVRSLLRQLFGKIIIPLWGVGTIWWDVRAANFCYAEHHDQLTLIDIDSLAAYASEILATPDVWERREKGRATALARLRQLAIRLVLAQPHGTRPKTTIEASVREIWQRELEPALRSLGRGPEHVVDSLAGLDAFLDRLAARELLGARS